MAFAATLFAEQEKRRRKPARVERDRIDLQFRELKDGVHVTLPYPPSVNNLYMIVRNRKVLGKEGRAYKKILTHFFDELDLEPTRESVVVSLKFYRPRMAGDLDNLLKALLDSMTGHIYLDDEQISELHVYRDLDPHTPRAEVTVTERKAVC